MVFYGVLWCDVWMVRCFSSPQDEWDEHTKELWIGWRKLHGPQRLGDSVRKSSRSGSFDRDPKKVVSSDVLKKRWLMMVNDG